MIDMVLAALGLDAKTVAAFKEMADPEKVERIARDLYARFEAMEKRNLEMYMALCGKAPSAIKEFVPQYAQFPGAPMQEMSIQQRNEMDAQMILFHERAAEALDGESNERCDTENRSGEHVAA